MLTDGFSLEFEWQQVSSSLQDSSQYSGRSWQCCSLVSLPRLVISESSSPCTNPLVTILGAPITNGIIVTFMFHNSLARSRYSSFFSLSFSFTLWSAGTAKSTIRQVHFFYVDNHKIWVSGRDLVIRLYLKFPEEFVILIPQDRFWVIYIYI